RAAEALPKLRLVPITIAPAHSDADALDAAAYGAAEWRRTWFRAHCWTFTQVIAMKNSYNNKGLSSLLGGSVSYCMDVQYKETLMRRKPFSRGGDFAPVLESRRHGNSSLTATGRRPCRGR